MSAQLVGQLEVPPLESVLAAVWVEEMVLRLQI